MAAYVVVGGVNITQDTSNPLSSASSLKVAIPVGAMGPVGFSNAGVQWRSS